MSAIAPSSSSSSSAVTQLLVGAVNPATAPPPQTSPSTASAASPANPSDRLDLSAHAKAVLAQAQQDKIAADKLQAFLESSRNANRASKSATADQTSTVSATSSNNSPAGAGAAAEIEQAFQRLTGQATDNAPSQPASKPFTNFSNQLEIDGFSISVSENAATLAYHAVINGPGGLSVSNTIFGGADDNVLAPFGESGGGRAAPGITEQGSQNGAVEYYTFTESAAAATSLTASSTSSSATASSVAAEASVVNIAIDVTTGSIQATESKALIVASAAQVNDRPL